MASTSSYTLLTTLEWIRRYIYLRPMALGNFLEPMLTSANMIVQTILGPPLYWRWNRAVTGFVTAVGQQDYTIFNWKPTFSVTTAFVLVDSNGNCQACTTGGSTGSSIPSFNNVKGGTTADGSAVWTNMGTIGTPVSTTYNFAWIETVSLYAQNAQTQAYAWKEISPKITLAMDSAQARPLYIAGQLDNGQGDVTFRMMPVPDATYPVAITIQQAPPIFTSLNQTWAPIPDEFSQLYNWGMLALMALYADEMNKFQMANNKFIASLLSSQRGLTQTERNIVLNNWQAITMQPSVLETANVQSGQVRTAI